MVSDILIALVLSGMAITMMCGFLLAWILKQIFLQRAAERALRMQLARWAHAASTMGQEPPPPSTS